MWLDFSFFFTVARNCHCKKLHCNFRVGSSFNGLVLCCV